VNAPTVNGVARAASIALILVLAAGAGLAVGNLLQEVTGDRSITAQASFSRDALDDLNALRAEQPTAADAYQDYAIRHAPVIAAYPDWAIRHPSMLPQGTTTFRLTGPSDVQTNADSATTDTFRLTGPSDVGVELRGQRKAE
jgi:hypothetical protein